jgi:hypothetical protein
MAFADTVHEVASMFELQAQAKGLRFVFDEPAACRVPCAPTKSACARSSSTCWATR